MFSLPDIVSRVGIPPSLQRQLTGSHNEGVVVTTQVKGLAELDAALTAFPNELAKGSILRAMTEATEAFRARAEELAPYDPDKVEGMHLVDGIRKEMRYGSHGVAGSWVHGRVGLHPDVWYGRLIETGYEHTSGRQIPPKPFFRPAFDEERYRALAIVVQRLTADIDAITRRLHSQ